VRLFLLGFGGGVCVLLCCWVGGGWCRGGVVWGVEWGWWWVCVPGGVWFRFGVGVVRDCCGWCLGGLVWGFVFWFGGSFVGLSVR